MKQIFLFCVAFCLAAHQAIASPPRSYEMAGEVTEQSVILQSRLADSGDGSRNYLRSPRRISQTLFGKFGEGRIRKARFEISETPDFQNSFKTEFQEARSKHDFIVKHKVTGLLPNTRYYYRSLWSSDHEVQENTYTFKTLPGALLNQDLSFVAVACMNYDYFKRGRYWTDLSAYYDARKRLGYPALEVIDQLNPDFLIGLGDNVYYDPHLSWPAKIQTQMRIKWHEQLSQERFVRLFSKTPTYWLMDDHDFRFDNANPGIAKEPSPELGASVFSEQLPVLGPEDKKVFYRTHRVNQALQIWILDNRTLRSANDLPDGPEKSIWGKEQLEWLKQTLLESGAPFRLIFSSTPIIGPDKMPTRDNHTSPTGFRYEGESFLRWLKENGFDQKNLYFIVGDSHWKYHSKHPLGFEEFSAGSLDRSNALLGTRPGEPNSTDPKGEIKQLYVDPKSLGGFLHVVVQSNVLEFSFYDSRGNRIYSVKKSA